MLLNVSYKAKVRNKSYGNFYTEELRNILISTTNERIANCSELCNFAQV